MVKSKGIITRKSVVLQKSVYEDKNRLHRDLELIDKLQERSRDGCPTVRFEALLILGKGVQRYLNAFVALASGIGPDIIVAGYGHGKLKVFDLSRVNIIKRKA